MSDDTLWLIFNTFRRIVLSGAAVPAEPSAYRYENELQSVFAAERLVEKRGRPPPPLMTMQNVPRIHN